MYGVQPEVQPIGETDNRLLRMLARTPTRLMDIDEPGFLRPDWVVTKPRLVGICGSESKAVFLDYASLIDPAAASGEQQNPMKNFVSMPHVMGHEVIAEVVDVGPEAEGLEPGDRVALNPWLTCVTRGVSPVCPACVAGDLSQCHSFAKGPFAPGIHIGMCADVTGGFADLMPAHDSMLFKVPDDLTDEQVVLADPFSVSLHAVTRHPPQPGGKVLVYGAGALGQCAVGSMRNAGWPRPSARRPCPMSPDSRSSSRWRTGRVGCCSRPTVSPWRSRAASTWSTTRSGPRRRWRSAAGCCGRGGLS